MSSPPPGLFPTRQQWRELRQAWRGRQDNPLLRYYCVSRARRLASVPLWRRGLVYFLGLAAGVGCVYCVWFQLGPFQHWGRNIYNEAYAALVLVTWPLMAWLGQGLFDALRGAASWFSLPDSRTTDPKLDPALGGSHLTGAEVAIGMLSALGAPVLWPACAMHVANMLSLLSISGDPRSNPAVGSMASLLPVSLVGMSLSTVLAVTSLLLLMACAGRGLKMAVHASVLAWIYSIGSLLFILITRQLSYAISDQYGPTHYSTLLQQFGRIEPLPYLAWLLFLLLVVLLPLAKSRKRLGLIVTYALPGLFLANFFALVFTADHLGSSGFDPTHLFFDTFFAWSMFAPVSAIAVPHPACLGTGVAHMIEHPAWHQWRWPMLVAAQFVLVCGLLRCALDSIGLAREAGAE